MKTQRRFLTKQEAKARYGKGWRDSIRFNKKMDYLLGLPVPDHWKAANLYTMYPKLRKDHNWCFFDAMTTHTPHPYESIDLKLRVTPMQSEMVQKKVFAMGGRWFGGGHGIVLIGGSALFIENLILSYSNMRSTFQDSPATELTYKQFMNGTVPKEKKQAFKAGDYVKVVDTKPFPSGHNPTHKCLNIGDVVKVWLIGEYDGVLSISIEKEMNNNYGGWFPAKNFALTDAPKTSNPTFKGYEVKPFQEAHVDGYNIGCEKVSQTTIYRFRNLCQQAKGYATPNEIYDFLEENKEFFNLK